MTNCETVLNNGIFTLSGVLLGGLIGWFSSWINHKYSIKKDKLQKLWECYANLITAFNHDIDAISSSDTIIEVSQEERVANIKKATDELGPRINSLFLKMATICVLLEKDIKITNLIKTLEKYYTEIRDNYDPCYPKNTSQLTKYEGNLTRISNAKKHLEEIRNVIHEKYKV